MVLRVELVAADLDVLSDRDGAKSEISLDSGLGLTLHVLDEVIGALPGGGQPRREVDALRLELLHHVAQPTLDLGRHHRLGRFDLDQFDESLGQAPDQTLADRVETRFLLLIADALAPPGDGLELADVVGNPVVAEFGQLEALDGRQLHGEVGRVLSALRHGREGELRSGFRAAELLVEVVGDPPLAHLVGPLLDVEARQLLTVAHGRQVNRHEITVGHWSTGVNEGAVALHLGANRLIEVLIGDRGIVDLDAQPGVAGDGDDRTDLALGLELDRAILLTAGHLDRGRGHQVDVVLADTAHEIGRDRVAKGLGARRREADTRLEELARSLSVAETRQLHLLGDRLEGTIDVAGELRLVDLDVQLDLVALEGFHRSLHRPRSLPVVSVAPPGHAVT